MSENRNKDKDLVDMDEWRSINYEKKLQKEIKLLKESLLSEVNKNLILRYMNWRLANSVSYARTQREVVSLRLLCQKFGADTPGFYHSETYRQFIEYYNERNADGIYSLASKDVKENHTLDEVRKELEFARNHSIEIISFDRPETPTISFDGNSPAQISTELVFNGSKISCSVKWVLYCGTIRENLDNSSLSRITGYTTKMGDWPFEELEKCYNLEQ